MLSHDAQQIIQRYLSLPFPGRAISAPYFNNRRARVRGALRVLVGKGTPEDIAQEATIITLREKVDLKALSDEQLKKFLVDHRLGMDCSGFVYHVLDAELRARRKKPLAAALNFPSAANIPRRLLVRLRPAENTDVSVFAHEKNSSATPLSDAQPGDLIVMCGAGPNRDRDHVLLIHDELRASSFELRAILYTHSFQWSADGQYNHGVRQGVIEITDPNKPLIDQRWIEQGMTGEKNETWRRAAGAQTLSIRRLKFI